MWRIGSTCMRFRARRFIFASVYAGLAVTSNGDVPTVMYAPRKIVVVWQGRHCSPHFLLVVMFSGTAHDSLLESWLV